MRRLGPLLGLAATLAASAALVAQQPVDSPWWTYADADATYTASGLNLLIGEHTRYLGHPGLPLQQLMQLTVGARVGLGQMVGENISSSSYADRLMLNLDAARPYYRTWAILFFLLGAALSFLLVWRLLGHWTWGAAAGLLWPAAPGLLTMSIQYRPDVPLAVLSLVIGYLIVRAADRRDAGTYALAAATFGFALTVKLHAVGLALPLAIAALWRPPSPGWATPLRERVGRAWRRRRVWIVAALAGWLALALVLNLLGAPFEGTAEQRDIVVGLAGSIGGYWVAVSLVRRFELLTWVRRVFNPFYGLLVTALIAGVLLPTTLALSEAGPILVALEHGLTGRGVNEGPAFSHPVSLDTFTLFPLRQASLVFGLALVAGLVGLAGRKPEPVLWATGAVALGILAQARGHADDLHYLAPAFTMSIPGALWLLRRGRRGAAGLLALPLVAYVLLPQFVYAGAVKRDFERARRDAEPSLRVAAERLKPGQVALTPSYYGSADTRFFELVQIYVAHTPEYPYRFLPASARAVRFAAEHGLRLRYYVGPQVIGAKAGQQFTPGDAGTFEVAPLAGQDLVVWLEHGQGADRPLGHDDARFDPNTGYFRDGAGSYFGLDGTPVASPETRSYEPKPGLWRDSQGRYWDADGSPVAPP